MTREQLNDEITRLEQAKAEMLSQLATTDGALQAFIYMRDKMLPAEDTKTPAEDRV